MFAKNKYLFAKSKHLFASVLFLVRDQRNNSEE